MRFDLLYEIGFWLSTYQFVHHFAALDKKDGRNAGNTVVDRQLRVVVNIYFAHIDLTVVFFGKFFNDRSDRAAGSAPFCPEINYRQLIGCNYLLLKVRICVFKAIIDILILCENVFIFNLVVTDKCQSHFGQLIFVGLPTEQICQP